MIYTLQSMRWLAIFTVFLSHLSFLQSTSYSNFYNNWIYGGNFGVSFFFLLSGFVFAYKYYGKIKNVTLKDSVDFTFRKVRKFYPLHFATTVFFVPNYFISYLANPIVEIPLLLANIFLLKSYIPNDIAYFSYNAASWLLSTLIVLYFLTLPILSSVYKTLELVRNKVLISIVYLIVIYLFGIFLIVLNKYDNQYTKWFFYISPFYRIFDFSLGMISGILFKFLSQRFINYRNILIFTTLEIFAAILLYIGYINRFNESKYLRYGMYYIPFLIIIILVFSFENDILSKLLKNKLLIFLADISFEFFLVHNIVITRLSKYIGAKAPLITCIMSFIVSIIISLFIKKILNYSKNIEVPSLSV